jgi:hypothetical protein
VLAVVECDQQPALGELRRQRVDHRLRRELANRKRARNLAGHERRIADWRQIHPPHTIRVIVKRLGGDLQGQPCLPAPTRSGQSEQARSAEQLANLCDLGLAANEAGELDGQVVREG